MELTVFSRWRVKLFTPSFKVSSALAVVPEKVREILVALSCTISAFSTVSPEFKITLTFTFSFFTLIVSVVGEVLTSLFKSSPRLPYLFSSSTIWKTSITVFIRFTFTLYVTGSLLSADIFILRFEYSLLHVKVATLPTQLLSFVEIASVPFETLTFFPA